MTMNLSGSLGAFGLDEVLSMLGLGGRTARMQVTSSLGIGSVHLVDGHVSAASQHVGRAGLLRRLVAESTIPADDLLAVLDQDEPVVALVEGGVVSRDTAHRFFLTNVRVTQTTVRLIKLFRCFDRFFACARETTDDKV